MGGQPYHVVRVMFEQILRKLEVIDAKVSMLPQVHVQVTSRLLPTIAALKALGGQATASQVAQVTGRARATESACLNELVGRGVAVKAKVRRTSRGGPVRVFTLREEFRGEGETMDC